MAISVNTNVNNNFKTDSHEISEINYAKTEQPRLMKNLYLTIVFMTHITQLIWKFRRK